MTLQQYNDIATKRFKRYIRAHPNSVYNDWPRHIRDKYYASMTLSFTT